MIEVKTNEKELKKNENERTIARLNFKELQESNSLRTEYKIYKHNVIMNNK